MDYASKIRLPNSYKSAANWKNGIDVIISVMKSSSICLRCFVSPAKFSYWSKFHVNIITGSGVMKISFIRDWSEIGNTPVWVLPNIWRLGRVRNTEITEFGTNVSNKMLLNAAKYQGYTFYLFWVIIRRGDKFTPTQIRVSKVAGLQVCSFIKKRLQHRYFPVKPPVASS